MTEQHGPPLGAVAPGGPDPNYQQHDLGSFVLWYIGANGSPQRVTAGTPLPVDAGVLWWTDGSGNPIRVSTINRLPVDADIAPHAASVPSLYRSAIAAADVVVMGAVTASKQNGGSCTANTYHAKVVAVNAYGRSVGSVDASVATSGTDLVVRLTFAQPHASVTHYDIHLSTDADPNQKWLGRITEAHRAAGRIITVAGSSSANCTTTAGGIAGAIDCNVPGTVAELAGTDAVTPTALIVPTATAVDCSLADWVRWDLAYSRTTPAVAAGLTVVHLYEDTDDAGWYAARPEGIVFGGQAAVSNLNRQSLLYPVHGASHCALAVLSLAGVGAALDVRASLT